MKRKLLLLLNRALVGVEGLPPEAQADMYEAAAHILTECDAQASDVALHTAVLIREAQTHQMQFGELIKNL